MVAHQTSCGQILRLYGNVDRTNNGSMNQTVIAQKIARVYIYTVSAIVFVAGTIGLAMSFWFLYLIIRA